MTAVQKRRVEPLEADVTWTEDRTIDLMRAGMSLVEAIELAARECTARVLDREARAIAAYETSRHEQRQRREAALAVERNALRAKLEAVAMPAQKPTLKATLGDLIAAKSRVTR